MDRKEKAMNGNGKNRQFGVALIVMLQLYSKFLKIVTDLIFNHLDKIFILDFIVYFFFQQPNISYVFEIKIVYTRSPEIM